MAKSRRGGAVHRPNLGLYLGIPPLHVPERGMKDCLNVRVKYNAVEKGTLGWGPFPDVANAVNLDGKPVTLIDLFVPRDLPQKLVLGNTTDLFVFNEGTDDVSYLTPRYQTGTVDVTNGDATVTGNGTTWTTNVKAGDFIHIGAADQVDPTATWYEVASVTNDTELELTTTYAGSTDTTVAYTIRSTFTGTVRDPFFTEVFLDAVNVSGTDGDRWYATNGLDAVVAWDGSADQVYRPNLGNVETCRAMRRFKNFMVYLAPTTSGDLRQFSVRISDAGAPEETVTGLAAELIIHDGSDAVMNAYEFGELLVLYSERHVTLMQYVGGDVQFVLRNAVSGMGPRSARAIAQFPDHHLFIGADTQYLFDGSQAVEVNNHVWREVVRRTSPQRLDMIHAHFDEENGELMWVLPLNSDADPDDGAPELALVHHYLEDTGPRDPDAHTLRELPATATGYFQRSGAISWDTLADAWEEYNFRWNDQALQDAFPYGIFGTVDGDIFILNSQDTKNGTAMTCFARFSRRPLGDKEYKGTVKRIYPFVERLPGAEHDLEVRLYGSFTADGPASQIASEDFDMGQANGKHFVSPLVTARYAEVEFRTVGVTAPWRLSGYDMDVTKAGSYGA